MKALDKLTHELAKLPGIGNKTALRLALFVIRQKADYSESLAQALRMARSSVQFCSQCFHLTDINPCIYCTDEKRQRNIICVVEESSDLLTLEKTRAFRGSYHVLQGALSPLDGIGPDELRIHELIERVQKEKPEEIILALNPNVNGDATSLYLSKLLQPLDIKLTKLAAGIPVGAEIEYVDQMTLTQALSQRIVYS